MEQCNILANLILRYTTTLGIRISESRRIVPDCPQNIKLTQYGPIQINTATGNGIEKLKPEYDDVAKIAGEKDITISDVMRLL